MTEEDIMKGTANITILQYYKHYTTTGVNVKSRVKFQLTVISPTYTYPGASYSIRVMKAAKKFNKEQEPVSWKKLFPKGQVSYFCPKTFVRQNLGQ